MKAMSDSKDTAIYGIPFMMDELGVAGVVVDEDEPGDDDGGIAGFTELSLEGLGAFASLEIISTFVNLKGTQSKLANIDSPIVDGYSNICHAF